VKKALPIIIIVFLYLLAILFDVCHEATQNEILQYCYWLFAFLANVATLYYIFTTVKRSKREKDDERG
jgi:bacteriorhodopsin